MQITETFEPEFDQLYQSYLKTETGRKLLQIEGIAPEHLDIGVMSKNFFTKNISDVSVDANANRDDGLSPSCHMSEITKGLGKIEGYYLLYHYARKRFGKERADELLNAVIQGDVYFHDSTNINVPYCKSFSTSTIMVSGRPYGPLKSVPPKRARSFVAQVIEVCMELSQSFAGAIAPGDFLVNYAYYAKKDNLTDHEIINDMQNLIFILNNKFRVGGDSPFTNVSIFDKPNLMKLFEHYRYPDGSEIDYDYVMKIQKLYAEFFAKGDPTTGLPLRFPISTINISCDENKNIIDKEFLDWVSKVNLKTGCFNIYINDGQKISSCCRMINDGKRMPFRGDSFSNGGTDLGSTRVVTINLPRIAIKANGDIIKFKVELNRLLDICRDLLEVHRKEILERRVASSQFLKFYNPLHWFTLDRMFNTVGITGIYEMNYFMGKNIRNEDGQEFTSDILKSIEEYTIKASEETGVSHNCEEVPGETATIKFAEKDKLLYGDKICFNLYSNQFLPLIENATIPERVKITGKFSEILSGGSILHLNVAEQIKDSEVMKKLIEYAVKNGVAHFAVSYSFGVCENEHTSIVGTSDVCPICGCKIKEHLTRVVGYFTPISSWSKVRREYEFPRRKFGKIKN